MDNESQEESPDEFMDSKTWEESLDKWMQDSESDDQHVLVRKPISWWIFFPFAGLSITDQYPELAKPVFGDVAIISKKHMESVLRRSLSKHMPKENFEQLMEWVQNSFVEGVQEVFQSYLAVRQTGILDSDNETTHKPDKLALEAKKRASEISSLLTLFFLANGTSGETCGLVEQIQIAMPQNITILGADYGGSFKFSNYPLNHSLASSPILDSESSLHMSSQELSNILTQNGFDNFYQIMSSPKRLVPKSSHNSIVQSSLRLSESVLSANFSTRLLGAITAIEILLTKEITPFKVTKHRVKTLLGESLCTQYKLENVFTTRNNYVHDGKEIEEDMSTKAIALALACILSYSDIAHLFSSKDNILAYLDFISTSEEIVSEWNQQEQQSFQNLLRHAQNRQLFPFVIKPTQ